jgi:hypothetical protein
MADLDPLRFRLTWTLRPPGSTHPQALYAVALLVLAGADVDCIVEHVD